MSDKLERAIAAAKQDLAPKVEPDWDAIDEKLFARIEAEEAREESSRVTQLGARSHGRGWTLLAGGLAAAAAIAVYAGHKPGAAPLDQGATASAPATASSLVRGGKAGEVLVGGVAASAGAVLHAGEALETHHAMAFMEREAPLGGTPLVAWGLEESSRVTVVKASAGTLVLALEQGSVEAQVLPVATGEAFAVDVPGADGAITRVAVHGTHLRVSRVQTGAQVRLVVDLSEGVVSIGAPPRAGSTYGALVTAPAHVELDTADASSLVVSHKAEDVRLPVDLAAASAPIALAPAAPASPAPQVAPHAPTPPAVRPVASAPRPSVADPNAEATVSAAVKACMSGRTAPADGQVTVTVSSSLEIRLNEDGAVDLARFNPPLPPDVQLCAANAIYKTRFPRTGTVTIELKF
jgi:hypothetical protein